MAAALADAKAAAAAATINPDFLAQVKAQLAAEADAEHLPQEMREQHEVWLAASRATRARRQEDVDPAPRRRRLVAL